ncbi:hypothetical protein GCM10010524_49880 [Streptomyces mexicanus]
MVTWALPRSARGLVEGSGRPRAHDGAASTGPFHEARTSGARTGRPGALSAGPRTDARDAGTRAASGGGMRAYVDEYTVAGQFRIRTGFPCGDSEHEHTSSAG